MIYSLDRNTPAQNIEKIEIEKLQEMARKLHSVGILAEAY
jgi:hypothetical protein